MDLANGLTEGWMINPMGNSGKITHNNHILLHFYCCRFQGNQAEKQFCQFFKAAINTGLHLTLEAAERVPARCGHTMFKLEQFQIRTRRKAVPAKERELRQPT